jgi:hypothetical protein
MASSLSLNQVDLFCSGWEIILSAEIRVIRVIRSLLKGAEVGGIIRSLVDGAGDAGIVGPDQHLA